MAESGQRPKWLTLDGLPALVIGLVLAVASCYETYRESAEPACFDYYQAWVAANALRLDEADVYTVRGRRELGKIYDAKVEDAVGTRREDLAKSRWAHVAHLTEEIRSTGTPLQYAAQGALGISDYDADQYRWLILGAVGVMLGVGALALMLGYPWAAALLAIAVAQRALPLQSDLWVGNVNRMQLAVLALFVAVAHARWLPIRHVLSGAVLGLAVAFKPNVAPLACVVALGWVFVGPWSRAWRSVVGAAVGAGAGIAVPGFMFGFDKWEAWFKQLAFLGGNTSVSSGNLASLTVGWLFGGGLAGTVLATVVFAGALGALGWWWRRQVGAMDAVELRRFDVLLLGVGGVVSAFAAPLVWVHYFVLVVPLALFVLRPSSRGGDVSTGLGVLGLVLVTQWPEKIFLEPDHPSAATMVTVGASLLLAAGIWEWLAMARRGVEEKPASCA